MNIAGIGIFSIVFGIFILIIGIIAYGNPDFHYLFATNELLLYPEDAINWMLFGIGLIIGGFILVYLQSMIGKWLEERDRKTGKIRIKNYNPNLRN